LHWLSLRREGDGFWRRYLEETYIPEEVSLVTMERVVDDLLEREQIEDSFGRERNYGEGPERGRLTRKR
jgi:hypothetical protein